MNATPEGKPAAIRQAVEAAARAGYDAQREAMVGADTAALDTLLADDFTLTHMTGYVQPKAEWLADVASRRMEYHSIEDVEVTVTFRGDEPVLVARTRTDATIWGGRGVWPLTLRIFFTSDDGQWIAARTVASTW